MPFHDAHYRREAIVTAYPVPLKKKLLAAFIGFAELYLAHRRPYELKFIRSHCKFDPTQYNSFSQLAHHDLIAQQVVQKSDGSTYTGWILTQRGEKFYKGEIAIWTVAGAWRGEAIGDTIPEDSEVWQKWSDSNSTKRTISYIHEITEGDVPQRAQYREDKHTAIHSTQLSLMQHAAK